MLSSVAQIGLPGTQELFIILLILFFFLIPVGIAVLVVVVFLLRRGSGSDERVEELEREVEALREERGTATGRPDDELE